MKSSCYFIFNHSVLIYPNLYLINLHSSLRTRSILVLVLSTTETFWAFFCDGFVSLTQCLSAMTADCKRPSLSPINSIVNEVTALHSTVWYAEMCLLSQCLETDCITSFSCCVRVSWGLYWATAWQCVDQWVGGWMESTLYSCITKT
jgi:hypothetical protein